MTENKMEIVAGKCPIEAGGNCPLRPQGECKDCNNCEDKALSYSMGLKDGYLLGGFQLTELRRWPTSQGYSEGTVDDKINEFTRFVEKIRGEE